jgi:hypothetical protein
VAADAPVAGASAAPEAITPAVKRGAEKIIAVTRIWTSAAWPHAENNRSSLIATGSHYGAPVASLWLESVAGL